MSVQLLTTTNCSRKVDKVDDKARVTIFIDSTLRKEFGAKCQLEDTNMSETAEKLIQLWTTGEIELPKKEAVAA